MQAITGRIERSGVADIQHHIPVVPDHGDAVTGTRDTTDRVVKVAVGDSDRYVFSRTTGDRLHRQTGGAAVVVDIVDGGCDVRTVPTQKDAKPAPFEEPSVGDRHVEWSGVGVVDHDAAGTVRARDVEPEVLNDPGAAGIDEDNAPTRARGAVRAGDRRIDVAVQLLQPEVVDAAAEDRVPTGRGDDVQPRNPVVVGQREDVPRSRPDKWVRAGRIEVRQLTERTRAVRHGNESWAAFAEDQLVVVQSDPDRSGQQVGARRGAPVEQQCIRGV